MQIVFFNVKTQNQYTAEVDDSAFDDVENIRILCKGDVYRPVSTVPDEVNRLNKLRVEFENAEFDALANEFKIEKKEDVTEDFIEKFSKRLDAIIPEKYKDYAATIAEGNKDNVYRTLMSHFLSFVFLRTKFIKFQEDSKSLRQDPCYVKDYAKRLKSLFAVTNWVKYESLSKFAKELDKVKQYMAYDDRRRAGYDNLLRGLGVMSEGLTRLLTDKRFRGVNIQTIKFSEEEYAEHVKTIGLILERVHEYYNDLIKSVDDSVAKVSAMSEDKVTGYRMVLKRIVDQFLVDTDNYIKEATATEGDEKKLDPIRKKFISELASYYENLNGLFMAYDADLREVKPEDEKYLVAIWESSNYYKDSKEGDWYLQLARLIFGSYKETFKGLIDKEQMDEEESSDH